MKSASRNKTGSSNPQKTAAASWRQSEKCYRTPPQPDLRLTQGSLQRFAERFLLLGTELLALFGEGEDVDGFLSFGINQRDFDIASQPCQRGTYVVEQPGAVLGHDLQQRAVCGRSVIEAGACLDGHLQGTSTAGDLTAFQQRLERRSSLDPVPPASGEFFGLAGVLFQVGG